MSFLGVQDLARMESTCRLFGPKKGFLSFPEIAAKSHCERFGIMERHEDLSWKQTLLPVRYEARWSDAMKHASVRIKDEGSSVSVSPDYTRGTFMTVFDSMNLNLVNENVEYAFRMRLGSDTSRAGITVGVVDPGVLNPSASKGCELCETPRGWGVFVCKGLRDKFTNGLYNGGKYLCGRESKDIRFGWCKEDVIEIRVRRGEILFVRNDSTISEVYAKDPKICGNFVFAITLYNSRLEVKSLACIRKVRPFEDPHLLRQGQSGIQTAASKGSN